MTCAGRLPASPDPSQVPAMSEPDLKPQEPGVAPGTDSNRLEAIAAGNVGEVVEELDALTVSELEQLMAIERQGKNRTSALGAIQREITAREEAEAELAPAASRATPIGDASTFARMRAVEVDPRKIDRAVLTLDGWVLPLPKAEPEG